MAPRPLHPAMAPWCHVQCAKVVRRPPPLLEVRTPIAIAIWGKTLSHIFAHKVLPSFQTFPPVDCDPVVFSKFVGSALRPYVPPPPYHHDVRSAPTVAVATNVERSSDPIGVIPYVLVWKDIGGSWQSFKNWKPASRHWVIDWSFETLHFEHLTMKPQTSAEHWRKPSPIFWIPWFANYVLLTVNLLRYVILKTVFLAILVTRHATAFQSFPFMANGSLYSSFPISVKGSPLIWRQNQKSPMPPRTSKIFKGCFCNINNSSPSLIPIFWAQPSLDTFRIHTCDAGGQGSICSPKSPSSQETVKKPSSTCPSFLIFKSSTSDTTFVPPTSLLFFWDL